MNIQTISLRLRNLFVVVAVPAVIVVHVRAQGTFQNLSFESPTIIPAPTPANPFAIEFGPAMPGWVGYFGTNQTSTISHNALSLSVANIAIMGPDNPFPDVLHGHYYVVMQNSFPTPSLVPAIAQTGMIPGDAESVRFYSIFSPVVIAIGVSFNGRQIPLSPLGAIGNDRYVWGGDISAFAGQTGVLRFFGEGYLDNIFFSPEAVPEPGTFALLALGLLLLGSRFLRRRT